VVGSSRETPAFAVDAITLWWNRCGRRLYLEAKELLILADSAAIALCRVSAVRLQTIAPVRL
jgi:Rhodopirellula transposase DDE domain